MAPLGMICMTFGSINSERMALAAAVRVQSREWGPRWVSAAAVISADASAGGVPRGGVFPARTAGREIEITEPMRHCKDVFPEGLSVRGAGDTEHLPGGHARTRIYTQADATYAHVHTHMNAHTVFSRAPSPMAQWGSRSGLFPGQEDLPGERAGSLNEEGKGPLEIGQRARFPEAAGVRPAVRGEQQVHPGAGSRGRPSCDLSLGHVRPEVGR